MRLIGKAGPHQTGLMRCYLQALARHDSPEMNEVAYRNYPGGISIRPAAFAHSADARSGVATVRLFQNQVDTSAYAVIIRFADGAREKAWMDLANPASGISWRLEVGTPRYQ